MDSFLVAVLSFGGTLLGGYLSSYLKTKGEHLATKEDIAEITAKIESVKHDYAQQLEVTKNELENHLKINSFRYEKEFSVLVELTEAVYKFREHAKEYGKIALSAKKNLTEPAQKGDFQRNYEKEYATLRLTAEKFRPFYAAEIYNLILEFDRVSRSCATHALLTASGTLERQGEFWDKAEDDAKAVTKKADEIVEAIRLRLVSWEQM